MQVSQRTIEPANHDAFVNYDNHHPHSGLGGYTPQIVFDGTWTQAAQARQYARVQAQQAHPDRFTITPKVAAPPTEATINLTNHRQATHTLPIAVELLAS